MSENESVTNEKIYNALITTKSELEGTIEEAEERLLLKLEEFNKRISRLEKENQELKTKIEILERKEKKNNIVIYGLKGESTVISPGFICNKLNEITDETITEADISNVYKLGKKEDCPVKIEFVSYLKKSAVIRNGTKLKGTEISISHDLTEQQRQLNRILRKHLYLARQNNHTKCYIKQNKLYVDDNVYTAEELVDIEDITERKQPKPNSSSSRYTDDNTRSSR